MFQFLTPVVGDAISLAPPIPQAVPIPVPVVSPPIMSGFSSYSQFDDPMSGKMDYPTMVMMGDAGSFGEMAFKRVSYGGGGELFGTSFVPQMPGDAIAVPDMHDVSGASGTVEVNRRSEIETEQRKNAREADRRPRPVQGNQMNSASERQTEVKAEQPPPQKSSLMRFILNVDS